MRSNGVPGGALFGKTTAHGTVVTLPQPDGTILEKSFTLADVAPLERGLQRIGGVKLIIIDPIGSYFGRDDDAHRDNEVRSVLTPLAAMANTVLCARL